MTPSELEEIFSELLDFTDVGSMCPLCHEGNLRYKPSPFIKSLVFRCDNCKAYLRWFQLSHEEKENVINSILRRWVKNLMGNLTDEQKKQLFQKWGSYV